MLWVGRGPCAVGGRMPVGVLGTCACAVVFGRKPCVTAYGDLAMCVPWGCVRRGVPIRGGAVLCCRLLPLPLRCLASLAWADGVVVLLTKLLIRSVMLVRGVACGAPPPCVKSCINCSRHCRMAPSGSASCCCCCGCSRFWILRRAVTRLPYGPGWDASQVPGLGSFIQLDLKARDHRVLRLEVPGDGRPVVAPLALFGMPGPEKKHRDPKRLFFPPPWQPNTTPK